MSTILYMEMNAVCICVFLLLLHNMRQYMTKNITIDQRIFRWYMILLVFILIFDAGMWYFDGKTVPGFYQLNMLSTICYYILNPMVAFVWLLYTDFKVFESRAGLRSRLLLYSIPCILNAILSISSIWTGWMFFMDNKRHYTRGPFFVIMAFVAFLYLLISFCLAVWNVKKNTWIENKNVKLYLLVYPILIICVSVIQILFFGISIIWSCCMLLCVSIYINIQNGEISTDHLTGLFNRRQMEEHFRHMQNSIGKNRFIFAVMMDLDDFKIINDTYGHQEGDRILVNFAELLRKSCKGTDDFVFRMGGDEYLIIGERSKETEVEFLLHKITEQVIEYNKNNSQKSRISFSLGSSVLQEGNTFEELIASADREMYLNKKRKKLKSKA